MIRQPLRKRSAFALIDLVMVTGILTALTGLFVGAVQKVRLAAAAANCQNNMRQIGQSLSHYHDVNKYFPSAREKAGTTWLAQILPFAGYEGAKRSDIVPTFLCPADRDPLDMVFQGGTIAAKASSHVCTSNKVSTEADGSFGKYACTDYVAVVSSKNINGPFDGAIYPYSRTRSIEISDGLSNTILVGERPPSLDLNWGWWASPYKGDVTMGAYNLTRFAVQAKGVEATASMVCPATPFFTSGSLDNPCDVQHFWSFHSGGGNWLFADGSVHFIGYQATSVIPKMATRASGEVIDWLEVFN